MFNQDLKTHLESTMVSPQNKSYHKFNPKVPFDEALSTCRNHRIIKDSGIALGSIHLDGHLVQHESSQTSRICLPLKLLAAESD